MLNCLISKPVTQVHPKNPSVTLPLRCIVSCKCESDVEGNVSSEHVASECGIGARRQAGMRRRGGCGVTGCRNVESECDFSWKSTGPFAAALHPILHLSLQMFMHPEHGWPEGPCSEPRPALASRLVKGAGGFGRHCGSQRSLASPISQANPVAVACGCTAYLCAGEGPQAWTREMRHT